MSCRARRVCCSTSRRTFDEDLSLDALAQRAGLSPSRFHRVFKQSTGETTRAYVERLRAARGAFLLATCAERSVLDVALETGLGSDEVFTCAFRRVFGVSPRDWRAAPRLGAQRDAHHVGEQS